MKPAPILGLILAVLVVGAWSHPSVSHSQITLTVTVCDVNSVCPTAATTSPTSNPSSGGTAGSGASGPAGGSSGGAGGAPGGAPSAPIAIPTSVTLAGTAYPNARVTLLKDGQAAGAAIAGADAKFSVTLYGIAAGTYTFSVIAQDSNGKKSVAYSFTEPVVSGANTAVSGVFLPPTVSTDKIQVKQGDPLTIAGQASPNAVVNVTVHSDQVLSQTVIADATGAWKYVVDSLSLAMGDHTVQAYTTDGDQTSSYSSVVQFAVGTKNVYASASQAGGSSAPIPGDLNGDGRVNLVDFSIMSYWFHRKLTPAAEATVDLNHDGVVDLRDFSILAYYWTG